MGKALSIKFDPTPMLNRVDNIEAGVMAAVRPAAQAGVQVLYDEVLTRVPVGKKEFHWFYGKYQKYPQNSGDLKRAIYQAFSQDRSTPYAGKNASKQQYAKATYHVTWRHKNINGFRGAPYGFMVEFGTSKAPAHPFLRPAFDAKQGAALEAARDRWIAETKKGL